MPSAILQHNEKTNRTIERAPTSITRNFEQRRQEEEKTKIVNSPPYICVQLQRIHRRVCALITKKVLDVLPSFYPFTYRHFSPFSPTPFL